MYTHAQEQHKRLKIPTFVYIYLQEGQQSLVVEEGRTAAGDDALDDDAMDAEVRRILMEHALIADGVGCGDDDDVSPGEEEDDLLE